jgi:hypothetical protein
VLRASYSSEDTPVHTRETICGDPARPSHRAGRRRRRVLGLVRCPDNFGEMLLVNLRKRRLAQVRPNLDNCYRDQAVPTPPSSWTC